MMDAHFRFLFIYSSVFLYSLIKNERELLFKSSKYNSNIKFANPNLGFSFWIILLYLFTTFSFFCANFRKLFGAEFIMITIPLEI